MEIRVKVEPTTWQDRTVYRAYYQKANGRWARLGKYEAASPAQLVEICERLRGAATLVWTNFTPEPPETVTIIVSPELEHEMLFTYHEYRSCPVGTVERENARNVFLAARAAFYGNTPEGK